LSKLALIRGLDVRVSDEDLKKLDYVSWELGFGTNRSKSIRYAIDFLAEYLAYEQHQREVEARQCTL